MTLNLVQDWLWKGGACTNPVPLGQAQPVPVGQADWDRLCLSQWDRQATCTKPVLLGLGKVKRDLSLSHETSHIPTLEAFPCIGTSSILTMELVPVPLVPNCSTKWVYKAVKNSLKRVLSFSREYWVYVDITWKKSSEFHKAVKIRWKEFCPFHENTGFTLTLLEKNPQNSNSEESSENRETFSWSKLRWGWVFLEPTRILSGIQFTTHFIEIFVLQTKRFVGSSVHVILTRQTCGQRSSKAAECKRRALGNYFSERICYMFLLSKCRRDSDLGLCTTSGLAFGEPQRNDKIRFFLRRNTFFFRKSPLRLGSPNASPEVVHRPRS